MADNTLTLREKDAAAVYELALAGPVTDLKVLQARMNELAKHANVLMPTLLGPIPAKQAIQPAVVQIDTTTDSNGVGPEVYFAAAFGMKRGQKPEDDEIALGKIGLLKLLGALGFSPDPDHHKRIDDRSNPHYVEFRAVLRGRDLTGQWQSPMATTELDLRDGSSEAKTMTPKQLEAARRKILRLCEQKAINAAIRGNPCAPIPQKLTRGVAARLWIVPRLVPCLDANDPADMELARLQASGAEARLFGGPSALPPIADPNIIEGEVIVGGQAGATAKVVGETPAPRAAGSTPVPSTNPDDDGDANEDFTAGAFEAPPEPEPPALILCLCPCGDQREITKNTAESTTGVVGAPRCRACFPGPGFDFGAHNDVRDLKLPKLPGLTLDQIRASNAKKAAKR